MNQLFRLLADLLGPVRMTVPEVGHRDPACEIEKFSFLGIPKLGTFAPYDFKNRTGIIANQIFLMVGRDHGHSIMHDFRTDSFVRKDFEQNAVGQATVNEVDAVHARVKGLYRAIYLGEHALGDHPLLLEGVNLVNGQAGKKTGRVFGVPQESRYVRQVNQSSCFQGDGNLGRCRVRGGGARVDLEKT